MSLWKKKEVKRLTEAIDEIADTHYEPNRIMYCQNYLMAICLSAELLKKIGRAFPKYH